MQLWEPSAFPEERAQEWQWHTLSMVRFGGACSVDTACSESLAVHSLGVSSLEEDGKKESHYKEDLYA